jgi:hypothetical protein
LVAVLAGEVRVIAVAVDVPAASVVALDVQLDVRLDVRSDVQWDAQPVADRSVADRFEVDAPLVETLVDSVSVAVAVHASVVADVIVRDSVASLAVQ